MAFFNLRSLLSLSTVESPPVLVAGISTLVEVSSAALVITPGIAAKVTLSHLLLSTSLHLLLSLLLSPWLLLLTTLLVSALLLVPWPPTLRSLGLLPLRPWTPLTSLLIAPVTTALLILELVATWKYEGVGEQNVSSTGSRPLGGHAYPYPYFLVL